MKTFRTFFKKEIFADVMFPSRLRQGSGEPRVVIMCDGAPSVPSKKSLTEFFIKKGYWVIHIRYRGTWESKGEFLKKSLDQDLLDVIDELPRGFIDSWTKEKYSIKPSKIILLGSSFGGPAVLLASRDPRVDRVITVSPVIDWTRDGKAERMSDFIPYMLDVYPMVYRASKSGWNKLLDGKFYNAFSERQNIDGSKIFILAAKDDDVVPFSVTKEFAKITGAMLLAKNKGGHIRSTTILEPKIWKKISKWMKAS